MDEANSREFCMEKKHKPKAETENINEGVRFAISKILSETVCVISFESQFLYLRNYMKRNTYKKIGLNEMPRSLVLVEGKKEAQTFVGLRQGGIVQVNLVDLDQKNRFEGVVNRQIEKLAHYKSKNWVIAAAEGSLAFISAE